MRKAISLLLLLALSGMAMAQLPTVRMGEPNKSIGPCQASGAKIVSYANGEIVVATYNVKTLLGHEAYNGVQVEVLDTNLNILRQVAIPNTSYLNSVVDANLVDGRLYLLYENRDYANYNRVEVDLESMTVVKDEPLIANEESNNKIHVVTANNMPAWNRGYYALTAKSENGDYFGLVCVKEDQKTHVATQTQLLLDDKYQPLWKKSYELKTMDDMKVDDNGVMYILGSTINSDVSKTYLTLVTLDVDGDQKIEDTYADGMAQWMKIASVRHGVVLAAGSVLHKLGTTRDDYDRILALAVDTKSRTMHKTTYTLTEEDLCVLNNNDIPHKGILIYPNPIVAEQTLSTDDGGVVAFHKTWITHHYGDKTVDFYEHGCSGTLMVKLDREGNVAWCKPIRTRYNENVSYEDSPLALS